MTIKIAVDAMGGDLGCQVIVPAVLDFLDAYVDSSVVLVGERTALQHQLAQYPNRPLPERLSIEHASEIVTMDESPHAALRYKKNSSMRVAVNLLKNGAVQACVSAGNTGALMATARFVLRMLTGIDRPAIAKMLPAMRGSNTCVLDLGANVDCTPEQLYQFALMGSMLYGALYAKEYPTVALLNIGVEAGKGNQLVKAATALLSGSSLNFCGNIEADGIYRGDIDVVVCDGFDGNVALKASEGLAKLMAQVIREEFTRHWWCRFLAGLAWPVLTHIKQRMDPRRYNGASLLGLNGIVVKSHGGADRYAFYCALTQAREEVRTDVLQRIRGMLAAVPAPLNSE